MHIITLETIDSTNLEARRRWSRRRRRQAFAIVARTQTAGVGRAGRVWQSPPGGLWMTVAWPLARPAAHYQALSLAAGSAVADALAKACGIAVTIKWPNDILVNNRKLAGILCQLELFEFCPVALIGVGINGNYPGTALPGGLGYPATTLRDVCGRAIDLEVLAGAVAEELAAGLETFEAGGALPLARLLPRLQARLAWVGQAVVCSDPTGAVLARGTLMGLDPAGQLVLQDGATVRAVAVGELRLRPEAGAGRER